MLIAVIVSFAVALAAPLLHARGRGVPAAAFAILPAALFAYFALQIPAVAGGDVIRQVHPWVPGLDVRLSFLLDGLSLVFALLITGFGALIVLYASGYLASHRDMGRFLMFILLFMSSMLGVVIADNLIALFVFWELTSFTSYLLIGFNHERSEARDGALQALLVTGLGGLAMLAGFLMLGMIAGGTMELSEAMAQAEAIRAHSLYLPILLLIVFGAFTKSAQFPFHFWLPNAMEAPTPVSAYLHSATMVKAGIYLLARTQPALGGTAEWFWLLVGAGGITMLMGGFLALRQTDLKRLLAYTTVAALGTLTFLLGLGVEKAFPAFVVFLIVHALYKGALFLIAGAVDHETGVRDVLEVGGLRKLMPVTATAAVLAGLSMAGLPPFMGFLAKELSYEAVLRADILGWLLPAAAVLANVFAVAVAGIVVVRPFFGDRPETKKSPHEAPLSMWLGPVLLAVLGLVFGIAPGIIGASLVEPAVFAVAGAGVPVDLVLWHGLNTALLLSAITLAAGICLYFIWDTVRRGLTRLDGVTAVGPERWYNWGLDGLTFVADGQTRLLQSGILRYYFLTIFITILGLVGAALILHPRLPVHMSWPDVTFYQATLAALIVLAAGSTILTRSRLAAVVSLGVVGFGVALMFVQLGSPDLAMTQFLVETLVVIIILGIMYQLPRFDRSEELPLRAKLRDAVIALGVGGLVTYLLLGVTQLPFNDQIPDFFVRESVPSGHGRNVVNVILVDFRALDTLGEIVVLAVAGMGAFALLKLGGVRPPRPFAAGSTSLILRTATGFLISLLLLFSIFLLLRGHNQPGGGFIGGLVGAGAFALHMLAFGLEPMQRLLRVHPRQLLAIGLGFALLAGLIAAAVGAPFLTAVWGTVALGGAGLLKAGTPLLFDIGVYLVVIGFTLTVVVALEDA